MRGYLQRMAASVLSRDRAIHPVVGSLWAPQGGAAPVEQSGETLVPGLRSVHDAETDRDQAQMRTNLHPGQDSAESNRVASEPAAQTNTSHSHAGSEMRLLLPMENALASGQIHSVQIQSSPIGEESGQKTEQPQSERSIFKPLLAEAAQRPVAAQNVAMQAPTAPHAIAPRSHPVAQPAHEPDTIEIHIGRIEVLAAQPQPVQRPPVRPAHKPLDLREYLGRGGRSR